MPLDLLQGQSQQRGKRVGGRDAPEEVVRLDVSDRTIARVRPPHEQQGRTVAALGVRGIVDVRSHGVRLAVAPGERGRALVHPLIAAQSTVRQLRRRDSRTMLPTRNATLAGRAAGLRLRTGYDWTPDGP